MVATEGRNNGRLVSEFDFIVGIGREESLKESDGGIENDSTLNTSLDAGFDLAVVDQI